MREFVFVFLYGAVTFASVLLAVFWARFAYRRYQTMPGKIVWDRYFVLSVGITLDALAWAVITGFRVVANVHYGLSKALHGWEGTGIAIGLLAALGAKLVLVWLADLQDHPPRWPWTRALTIGTLVWGLLAALTVNLMPPGDVRPAVMNSNG